MKDFMKLLFFLLLLIPVHAAAQDKYRMDSLITELEREISRFDPLPYDA